MSNATSKDARLSDDPGFPGTGYCGTAIPTVSPPMFNRSGFPKALRGDQYHRNATFPGQEKYRQKRLGGTNSLPNFSVTDRVNSSLYSLWGSRRRKFFRISVEDGGILMCARVNCNLQ